MYSTRYLLFQSLTAVAIGDALGVPYQFKNRDFFAKHPVSQMEGYKTFNVPAGTWSDDTSLTIAALISLSLGLNYYDMMSRFAQWYYFGDYTPYGKSFDIGRTTQRSIERFAAGVDPLLCGGTDEYDNGNGALMRIVPIAFYIVSLPGNYKFDDQTAKIVHDYSSLTHGHPRSLVAAGILANATVRLIQNPNQYTMLAAIREALKYYQNQPKFKDQVDYFTHLGELSFYKQPESKIQSSGYVVDTLDSVFWCLMNSEQFYAAVKKAVNLGNDADTIGSITAMLASLLYAPVSFPTKWLDILKGRNQIKSSVSIALLSPNF
ncbi:ADP-ribosylation Crystallin J1 [Lentilactobacillus senioris DSM 24302 = JCM 17472]|uniref:ADP-ribosylation Crystallin J1 n=1 Tax=Lentilactobacillus senioris DSM 24302 = JCM 17472 TaxID=1423802 RepID=A0A0R2D1U5_9LACO|nr:ADP-ribosylglycohydrolase family protein [Lentilactobacillus senioris]KRM94060.1 ADP-ribosylation Crystallin J1 [Lentilactobacillus senioris DSM 24302 = JCM 17472]